MLKEWQFNILFFVGVGSAVFLLIGPEFGLSIAENPTALAGVGSILTYILTQKGALIKKRPPPKLRPKPRPRPKPKLEDSEGDDE